ncbi:hypothetical protein BH20BAC1_BH20BAC1_17390 [soil metagenome]
MNNLKILSLIIFFGFVFPQTPQAQRSIDFGINISHGSKQFMQDGRRGLGIHLGLEKQLFPSGSLRVLVAYDWFQRRWAADLDDNTIRDSMQLLGLFGRDISFLPVRLGYRQYFYSNAYVDIETGFSRLFSAYDKVNRKYSFTYSVGTGYKILLKEKNIVEVSMNYNYNRIYRFLNLNYLSFRVAYGITKMK